MEILQPVRVRRERWLVVDIRPYDTCQLLTLTNGAGLRRFLAPFDDVEPVAAARHPRRVGTRRWRRACRAAITSHCSPGGLRAALEARIDLLPHQLEPALSVLHGRGCRLLLADDVGLGKTIQAGLVVAELMARRLVERVLVLAPSGLRDQWALELRQRFAADAVVADARTLRQTAAALPLGVNPWTVLPVAIASLDYVKRPEVLPALRAIPWDVVVVDEAHSAAGDSDRRQAVRVLGERAPYVLLLTATPHSGDEGAFAALCALGEIAGDRTDPLLLFRRTRRMVRGEGTRRIRTFHIRPSALERQMHEALHRYARAVSDEHGDRALALSVLEKRAFSSPWSLAQSVDRRRAAIASPPDEPHRQIPLPLGDVDGELTDDDAPPVWPADLALADVHRERRLLEDVSSAAHGASAGHESKLRALQRFLRRVHEPALVFTEYRDTAAHLQLLMPRPALLLHGGMDRPARAAVIDLFHRQPSGILIATEAAGQGLNFHRACRLVVNVELPWNPMRLEQRIGRVDRIGQPRTVHAVHLVSRSTGESRILGRLRSRVTSARETLDVPDPVGGALAVEASGPARNLVVPDFRAESVAEAARIESLRRFIDPAAAPDATGSARPLVARARRRRLRAILGGRTLAVFRIVSRDALGGVVDTSVLGVLLRRPHGSELPAEDVVPLDVVDKWHRDVSAASDGFWRARIARERAIAGGQRHGHDVLFQPALFDRRADRSTAAGAAASDRERDARARMSGLERRAVLVRPSIELLLLVLPR